MEDKKEENKTGNKEKAENNAATQQQVAPQTNPQAPVNSEAELMTSLFNFIKHPAVTAIGGYFIGKYFEAKKQESEQEKITERLTQQIRDLKEELKNMREEKKALGIGNEQNRKRLSEGKNNHNSQGYIQLD